MADDANKKSADAGSSIDTTSTDALSTSSAVQTAPGESATDKKKKGLPGTLKKFSHRFNIYLLFFVLVLVLAGAILVITALASRSVKNQSAIGTQNLSSDTLKQLSSSDATVGDPKQVLNVQSNAVFAGKVLVRDTLEVAGQIRVGGPMSITGITVSGESNFDQLNVTKSANIGGDSSIQGQLNVKKNLAVSGNGTFGGAVTAPQIATSTLQLLGDLTLIRHISAGGATPGRSIGTAVGPGGTASVSGSDTAGFININTGSSPSAGCFVTVNFATRFTATPRVLITPVGSDAGNLTYYVNRNSSSFSVCVATVPPPNASFGFDYFALN